MGGKDYDDCPPSTGECPPESNDCPPHDDNCPPSNSRNNASKGKVKAVDDCPPADDYDDGCPKSPHDSGPMPRSSNPKETETISRSLPIQAKGSASKSQSTAGPSSTFYSAKPAERTQIKSVPKSSNNSVNAMAPAKSQSRANPTAPTNFYSRQAAERTAIKPKPSTSSASSNVPSQSKSRTRSSSNTVPRRGSSSQSHPKEGQRVVPYDPKKPTKAFRGMLMIYKPDFVTHDGYKAKVAFEEPRQYSKDSRPFIECVFQLWYLPTKRASEERRLITEPHPNPSSLGDWRDNVRHDGSRPPPNELVDISQKPHYLDLDEVITLIHRAVRNAAEVAWAGILPWEMMREYASSGEYNEDWSSWDEDGTIKVTTTRKTSGCMVATLYSWYRVGYRFITSPRKIQGDIITWDFVDVDRYQRATGTQLPPTEVMAGWFSPMWYKYEWSAEDRGQQPDEWRPDLDREHIVQQWLPVARYIPVIPVIPVAMVIPY